MGTMPATPQQRRHLTHLSNITGIPHTNPTSTQDADRQIAHYDTCIQAAHEAATTGTEPDWPYHWIRTV